MKKQGQGASGETVPLVVDLDGTLIHEESHQRFWWLLCREQPWCAVRALCVLIWRGRLAFKRFCVYQMRGRALTWAIRQELLAWLKEEQRRGRRLILATGAPRLAIYLVLPKHVRALFSEIWTSTQFQNFVGKCKAERLCVRFGAECFDYVGNSMQDIPVWRPARRAYIVETSPVQTWWLKRKARCALRVIGREKDQA